MASEERKSLIEQQLWKRIEELEKEKHEESLEEKKKEIDFKISLLKKKLSELSSPRDELEKKLKEKEQSFQELKEKYDSLRKAVGSVSASEEPQKEKELRFKLYKFLLQKYTELINESEKKTIGEIKGLIDTNDLTTQSVISNLKPEEYEFRRDYLETAEKAYEFVSNGINCIDSGIELNYWLSSKELISLKAGDDEDVSLFLCNLLNALGDGTASVMVAEMEDSSTHSFVISAFNSKFMLLDSCSKSPFNEFIGEKTEVLQKYSFNGLKIKRFLYKFNSTEYEQFIEEETE